MLKDFTCVLLKFWASGKLLTFWVIWVYMCRTMIVHSCMDTAIHHVNRFLYWDFCMGWNIFTGTCLSISQNRFFSASSFHI
jgi:hypothetical protein